MLHQVLPPFLGACLRALPPRPPVVRGVHLFSGLYIDYGVEEKFLEVGPPLVPDVGTAGVVAAAEGGKDCAVQVVTTGQADGVRLKDAVGGVGCRCQHCVAQ